MKMITMIIVISRLFVKPNYVLGDVPLGLSQFEAGPLEVLIESSL